MGKSEVEGFLSHLASDGKVSASTQRQALNAIVFLYRDVLDRAIHGEIAPVRAKRHASVPVVLTQGEVQRVLREMHGTHLLMAKASLRRGAAAHGVRPAPCPGPRF